MVIIQFNIINKILVIIIPVWSGSRLALSSLLNTCSVFINLQASRRVLLFQIQHLFHHHSLYKENESCWGVGSRFIQTLIAQCELRPFHCQSCLHPLTSSFSSLFSSSLSSESSSCCSNWYAPEWGPPPAPCVVYSEQRNFTRVFVFLADMTQTQGQDIRNIQARRWGKNRWNTSHEAFNVHTYKQNITTLWIKSLDMMETQGVEKLKNARQAK